MTPEFGLIVLYYFGLHKFTQSLHLTLDLHKISIRINLKHQATDAGAHIQRARKATFGIPSRLGQTPGETLKVLVKPAKLGTNYYDEVVF